MPSAVCVSSSHLCGTLIIYFWSCQITVTANKARRAPSFFGMPAFDESEAVEDGDGDDDGSRVVPTDDWDDGEACDDDEWSVQLWCARCGARPRPEHGFRCRMHDDTLCNGPTRPVAPLPPRDDESEAMSSDEWVRSMAGHDDAMAEHKRAMDRWEPEWLEPLGDGPEVEPVEAAERQYPLPCVRCARPTALCGSPTMGFTSRHAQLRSQSPWLPEGYLDEGGEEEGRQGRVKTNTGEHGACGRCQLNVSIVPGGEE